jgi:hypothetical protein
MKQRISLTEKSFNSLNGYAAILIALFAFAISVYRVISIMSQAGTSGFAIPVVCAVFGGFMLIGLYMLQPNEGAILTLFGSYRGTDRNSGLRWCLPFYSRKKISLRSRNFNSETVTRSKSALSLSGACTTPHKRCLRSKITKPTFTCSQNLRFVISPLFTLTTTVVMTFRTSTASRFAVVLIPLPKP